MSDYIKPRYPYRPSGSRPQWTLGERIQITFVVVVIAAILICLAYVGTVVYRDESRVSSSPTTQLNHATSKRAGTLDSGSSLFLIIC